MKTLAETDCLRYIRIVDQWGDPDEEKPVRSLAVNDPLLRRAFQFAIDCTVMLDDRHALLELEADDWIAAFSVIESTDEGCFLARLVSCRWKGVRTGTPEVAVLMYVQRVIDH